MAPDGHWLRGAVDITLAVFPPYLLQLARWTACGMLGIGAGGAPT